MSMWSLRWHFTNKSVAEAPYSIKGYSYSLSHRRVHCESKVRKCQTFHGVMCLWSYNLMAYTNLFIIIIFFYTPGSKDPHTHTRLTALYLGLPMWAGTRKVKPIWILHQLGHMQVCTSLQTDNHASTPPVRFFYRPDAPPAAQPTAS